MILCEELCYEAEYFHIESLGESCCRNATSGLFEGRVLRVPDLTKWLITFTEFVAYCMNKITYLVAIAIVLLGGWWLLTGSVSQPLAALTPLEASPLAASATLSPTQPVAGEPTTLTFSFSEQGQSVTNLMTHHGRKVHVVLVGKDLGTLGHIHPMDFPELNSVNEPGTYSVQYTFPEAGQYIVAVDVMNTDGALAQQYLVNVRGAPKMASDASSDFSREKCFKGYTQQGVDRYINPYFVSESEVPCSQGYKATLTPASGTIVAGQETLLRFHYEKGDEPLTDLAPFLDAPIHFAIVPSSLDFVLHRHGEIDETLEEESSLAMMDDHDHMAMDDADSMEDMEGMHEHAVPASFGPDLISEPIIFPETGVYRVFAQTRHGSKIIMASFLVKVEAASAAPQGESKTFDLEVHDRAIVSGASTLTVKQGDTVTITIVADEDEELHVHGYDKSVEFKAGEKASITFVANASGRFPFELEGSKTDIGALEVQP